MLTPKQQKDAINSFILKAMGNPFVIEHLSILKQYDIYTFIHSINVASESILIGLEYGFNDKQLLDLTYAAILHDIGKVYIDINIINKKGLLSKAEFNQVKAHPLLGAREVRTSKLFSDDVVDGILMHHENFDGLGYYNIPEPQIPVFAKIIRIADTFDAMTDKRPYHNAKSEDATIQLMLEFKDLDPEILKIFSNSEQKGKNICTIIKDVS